MPKFVIEVYEVGTVEYEIEADDINDALRKFNSDEADMVDNSTEFVENDVTRGVSRDEALELGIDEELIEEEWGIPTVRTIREDKG